MIITWLIPPDPQASQVFPRALPTQEPEEPRGHQDPRVSPDHQDLPAAPQEPRDHLDYLEYRHLAHSHRYHCQALRGYRGHQGYQGPQEPRVCLDSWEQMVLRDLLDFLGPLGREDYQDLREDLLGRQGSRGLWAPLVGLLVRWVQLVKRGPLV